MKSHNDRSRDNDFVHSTTIDRTGDQRRSSRRSRWRSSSSEAPMDKEGATPSGVRGKDSVEAGRIAIVGEGANFGEEASDNLVGEEDSVAPEF